MVRRLICAGGAGGVVGLITLIVLLSASTSAPGANSSRLAREHVLTRALAAPPAVVVASRRGPSAPRGLRSGTAVRSADVGVRVFADSRHGFALASVSPGWTYPVATTDGGRHWQIAGPVFDVPAAQGATVVSQPGVAGPRTYFAWEQQGFDTVVDTTTDAGKHWWQASLPGGVLSVVGDLSSVGPGGGLTAIVQGPSTGPHGRGAFLWIYQSTTGRRWTYRGSQVIN